MKKKIDLTEGCIYKKLFVLAVPIILTSFLQMAYNIMDMFWVGQYDSSGIAVSAVGTAGFFTWFGAALIELVRIGSEVKVSQTVGAGNLNETHKYVKTAIQGIIGLGLVYAIILLLFKEQFIGFFNTGNSIMDGMSIDYLRIISIGIVFYFINPVFTAIFNGSGDSFTPLIINFIGILVNLILDPVLIYGLGGLPEMGVSGAALATIISQGISTIIFIIIIFNSSRGKRLFKGVNIFSKLEVAHAKSLFKIGLPVAIQSGLFTCFSMGIARIITRIDPIGIGVQKVGSQIESISWMTAGGFRTALGTFIGQNYGAKKWDRIYKGYLTALSIVMVFGTVVTLGFIFGAETIFKCFISDPAPLAIGTTYLKILGISQLFMCIEITTAGAFNGLGKTHIPSIVSILFTGARLPASFIFAVIYGFGLNGVWWSISMSSIFKGVVLVGLFILFLSKHPEIGFDKIRAHFRKGKTTEIEA